MTLTFRIYFIRFLFIALGGDLPGMYLFFFSLFLFIEHGITHRFYGKKFRFEKKMRGN